MLKILRFFLPTNLIKICINTIIVILSIIILFKSFDIITSAPIYIDLNNNILYLDYYIEQRLVIKQNDKPVFVRRKFYINIFPSRCLCCVQRYNDIIINIQYFYGYKNIIKFFIFILKHDFVNSIYKIDSNKVIRGSLYINTSVKEITLVFCIILLIM